METFEKIITEIYGITLPELLIQSVDSILYIISLILVAVGAIKIFRKTRSTNAKSIVISIIGTVLSSFVSIAIAENSEDFGVIEVTVILVPSLFMLVAAISFYRLCSEPFIKCN
ncbi:hypothetical protein C1E23_18475 [Pseudoalteromonas phenolica]|uniref:Uncharacterized protein n=1 Tax=Pseudoalteromonas phenolica TaxID=161398 RepID=A0A4Q7IK76_9GAMM|nr:hypothetical protein [Pseudoalteromonas phenolica]RZQ51626.1 hypothetical protein C1E23_18475 [Pseudoalteromonas phenolica]